MQINERGKTKEKPCPEDAAVFLDFHHEEKLNALEEYLIACFLPQFALALVEELHP